MTLLGTKSFAHKSAAFALIGVSLSACMAELPGGETGPFAAGNEVTFYYQTVLTDPPDQAQIVSCDENQFVRRNCIQLSNNATFPLTPTESGGVMYGNDDLQVIMQPDEGGLPSGVGQVNTIETGEQRGFRWVSLPSSGGVSIARVEPTPES